MKTDTLFYRLFQSFPSIFFELIDRPPEEAAVYRFSSVEVKQLAFRIDGVFLPSADAPEQPIYFAEVQFQSDSKFYSRFFAEIFLYLSKTDLTNDWRGVVVYPTRSVDTGEIRRYSELLNSRRVSRIYLDELGEVSHRSISIAILQLVIANEEVAIEQARELIDRARLEIERTFPGWRSVRLLQEEGVLGVEVCRQRRKGMLKRPRTITIAAVTQTIRRFG